MKRRVPHPKHHGIYCSDSKRGTIYEVSYKDSQGKRRFKSFGLELQDALDFQADIRLRLRKGERVIPRTITVTEVVRQWEQTVAGKTFSTKRAYENIVNNRIIPQFGKRRIQSVTTDDIAVWLADLRTLDGTRELSGASKMVVLSVLNLIFEYAVSSRRGYLAHNPCADLERGERPRPVKLEPRILTPAQTKALLDACPDWLVPLVQTSMYTGMRAGEVIGLKWKDVDFDNNVLRVSMQLTPRHEYKPVKGKNIRRIELFPPLRRILVAQPTRFRGEWVFVSPDNGKPFWYARVREAYVEAREKAGIPDEPRPLRMHDLRHTFASALLRDGKDVAWVSGMLGHASIQTTLDTYTHVMERESRSEEAVMRLKEAFGDV